MPKITPHNPIDATPQLSPPVRFMLWVITVILHPVIAWRSVSSSVRFWRKYRPYGFSWADCRRIRAAIREASFHLGLADAASLAHNLVHPSMIHLPPADRVEMMDLAASLVGPPRYMNKYKAFNVAHKSAQRRNQGSA